MLSVYRASAGSGKTHRLTGEYLLLLFSQPGAYKNILAVTFTNKATDEMKGRIVEELFNLASDKPSDYISLLSKRYNMAEEQIRQHSYDILVSILHDYSAFNICTIDSFFQQTMRAFTREIGLQGGYGIEMDEELVLTEAVDKMLSELDKSENKDLLDWLLRFAESKIEDGEDWKLRRDIQSLGKELFKENYKAFSNSLTQEISDKKILETYKGILYGIIQSTEQRLKELGEKGIRILNKYELRPEDFKDSSRSPLFFFQKLINGKIEKPTDKFKNLADNLDNCFTSKTSGPLKTAITTAFENGLNDCIKEIIRTFDNLTEYYTAKEIVRYYYTLGILKDISVQIAAYREDNNIMLIADTTELLNKVINGSDAPFIYEKIGTRINNYMIDEFQDTSNMQWSNFRPLIKESLSNNRDNLIVGDVKQSIYRFRNSDWKLLDEQIANDFSPEEIREETLKDNWRSCGNIVYFNNALFSIAPLLLQSAYNSSLYESSLNKREVVSFSTRIMSAYKNCCQRIPKPLQGKAGHVLVNFIEKVEEVDWKEEALSRLPGIIERLQSNGYDLKDIAILVRTNAEGAKVADYLLEYKEHNNEKNFRYDIISDEALYISSAPSVRFIIAFMRFLKNPDNNTYKQMALFSLKVLDRQWNENDFPSRLKSEIEKLSLLPLYEMAEKIFKFFSGYIPENEQIFVMAFLDSVAEFEQKEGADLKFFLDWWEEKGCKKTISTPDKQNAIRIITIHKSKGLGFKAVIIPFCDWNIDHRPSNTTILWCKTKDIYPFNKITLLPVRYGSNLKDTIFANDYFKEKLHAYIDNLNTLYVAFTRAKEELIIFSPEQKKAKNSKNTDNISCIAKLLWECFRQDTSCIDENEKLLSLNSAFQEENIILELGDYWKSEKTKEKGNISEMPVENIQVIPFYDRLHIRLRGKNYFFDDTERKHGTLMHEVLSSIRTSDDILPVLHEYQQQGIINREEEKLLIGQIEEYLKDPRVEQWYNGEAEILNEAEIIFGKGETRRPDRIMIYKDKVVILDYKFGKKQYRTYQYQVQNYINLVTGMGYANVSGYIWYVSLGIIEPVKPKNVWDISQK